MHRTQAMPTFTEWFTGLFQPNQKAVSHRPDLANRVHVYSEYSDAKTQPEMSKAHEHYDVYGSYVWARKAIGKIAENMRSLPVLVYSPDDEPLWNHEVSQVLSRGNDEYSPSQLWEQYAIYLMTTGEAFFEIVPDGRGKPAEMWIRESDRMYVRPDVANMYYRRVAGYLYRPEEAGLSDIDFAPEEVIFDKLFNPLNAWRGISPIHAVREGITIDLFSQAYSKTFLKNNARPDFAVTTNIALTEGERERIEGEFMQRYSGSNNWHKPAILDADGGLTVAPFSFAPKDTEWLEQRRFSRDEVGAIFGVPDEIMGYGRDTYENFQTALETFWTLTIKPLCDHRDDVLTHFFRHRRPILRDGEYIGTDLTSVGVLQEDVKPKVEMAEILVRMGYDLNAVNERFQLGMAEQVDDPAPVEVAAIAEHPQQDDEPDGEPMPAKAIYLPGPVRDALRSEVTKAIEIRTKLIAGGNFDEDRWRTNAEKAFAQWLDNGMAQRLVDTLATRSDADALIGSVLSTEIAGKAIRKDAERADLEEQHADKLSRAFRRVLREVVPAGTTADNITPDIAAQRLQDNRQIIQDALVAMLRDAVMMGVQDGQEQIEKAMGVRKNVSLSVVWDQVSQIALSWILGGADGFGDGYGNGLTTQIMRTSEQRIRDEIARWVEDRTPLRNLTDALESTAFSRSRAEMIAQTEATRAFAEGNRIAFRESGIVQRVRWNTARDELVCPICGPLDRQTAPIDETFDGGYFPPAHPRCRCDISPVIEVPR